MNFDLSTALELAAALHVVAAIIVNITPTPKDNALLGKVYRWVEVFAGLVTPLAKR